MGTGAPNEHDKTDRRGHATLNPIETQALKETLDRQDALGIRREHGLVKQQQTRHTVLVESTVCSTRGPEVEEDRDTRAKARDGARPGTSRRGTPLTPRALRALERASSVASLLDVHQHSGPSSRRSSDVSGPLTSSSRSSTSRPANTRPTSLLEEESWDEEVARDLPLLDDLRVLPLACARLKDLRLLPHTKEDYGVLRARRAERFLAHAHATRHRAGNHNNQATHEAPDHHDLPPRPLTAPPVGRAQGPTACTTSSSARSVVRRVGSPRGGKWKCVKKATDLGQRGLPNLPTPWALHYEEAPTSKRPQSVGQEPTKEAKGGRRDRVIKQLQQRVGLILAQLTDVNERLEGLQKHAPPPRARHAPPHFLTTTQTLKARAIKPKLREPKGRAFIP